MTSFKKTLKYEINQKPLFIPRACHIWQFEVLSRPQSFVKFWYISSTGIFGAFVNPTRMSHGNSRFFRARNLWYISSTEIFGAVVNSTCMSHGNFEITTKFDDLLSPNNFYVGHTSTQHSCISPVTGINISSFANVTSFAKYGTPPVLRTATRHRWLLRQQLHNALDADFATLRFLASNSLSSTWYILFG
jgi:hypothetical protein